MTPRLILPDEVTRPCPVARIGPRATLADLERAYMQRGAQLVACDAARALAVQALTAERALKDTRQ